MKKNKKTSVIGRIINYVRPHKVYFYLAMMFAILAIGLTLLNPILIGKAIDNIISKGNVNFKAMTEILVYIAVASVTSAVFEWLLELSVNKLSYCTAQTIRQDIFNKVNSVPLKYIDNTPHGDIMNSMIVDVGNVTDGFLEGFQTVFSGAVTLLATLIFMLTISPMISLIVVLITPLSIFVAVFITKRAKKMFRQQVNSTAEMSGFAEEMIGNMKTIKAFGYEDETGKDFARINQDLYVSSEKAQFYGTMTNPCTRFVNGCVYAITGVVGAISAIRGHITIGQISSFLTYSQEFTKPFSDITGVLADLQVALASARRIFDMLDQPNEVSDRNNEELKTCNGEVKVKNVNFSYEPDFKLIENLNFTAKRGEKIAIVGPTGCGKTTIINLLMRFYDTNSGEIKVSNKDIKKLKRASFRSYYGMVLQDSWLYSATIRDNIAYGKPNATMEEIVEAAKKANAHQFIERMEKGYDTMISERADNISSGQKQLICIARIMLTNPAMLILDEATSNTDTRTEHKIQEAFNEVMKGKTCFIVAHRLSTIINADKILVMNNGNVIEQGNHEELMAKNGFYTQLFNSQFAS